MSKLFMRSIIASLIKTSFLKINNLENNRNNKIFYPINKSCKPIQQKFKKKISKININNKNATISLIFSLN